MTELERALEQIRFARAYTNRLLERLPEADWFRQPPGVVTHVAWQVGHLAVAEYRLALARIRGARAEESALLSEEVFSAFRGQSIPAPQDQSPPLAVIRTTFARVHEAVLHEGPTYAALDLGAAPLIPHDLCSTQLDCLFWAAQHELIHAGQIGLLRRLLGHAPLW
jgi:hypothetical protein